MHGFARDLISINDLIICHSSVWPATGSDKYSTVLGWPIWIYLVVVNSSDRLVQIQHSCGACIAKHHGDMQRWGVMERLAWRHRQTTAPPLWPCGMSGWTRGHIIHLDRTQIQCLSFFKAPRTLAPHLYHTACIQGLRKAAKLLSHK